MNILLNRFQALAVVAVLTLSLLMPASVAAKSSLNLGQHCTVSETDEAWVLGVINRDPDVGPLVRHLLRQFRMLRGYDASRTITEEDGIITATWRFDPGTIGVQMVAVSVDETTGLITELIFT